MKKALIFLSLFLSTHIYAQSNNDLKTEVDHIKTEIRMLKTEIQRVITQNNYLKQALDLNVPILEIANNKIHYQIIEVKENIKDKTIVVTMLINTTESNRKYNLSDFSIVDLNGNSYKIDYAKSSSTFPELTMQVPLKFIATFTATPSDLKVLKLFKFSTKISPDLGSSNTIKSVQAFKDLIIN